MIIAEKSIPDSIEKSITSIRGGFDSLFLSDTTDSEPRKIPVLLPQGEFELRCSRSEVGGNQIIGILVDFISQEKCVLIHPGVLFQFVRNKGGAVMYMHLSTTLEDEGEKYGEQLILASEGVVNHELNTHPDLYPGSVLGKMIPFSFGPRHNPDYATTQSVWTARIAGKLGYVKSGHEVWEKKYR